MRIRPSRHLPKPPKNKNFLAPINNFIPGAQPAWLTGADQDSIQTKYIINCRKCILSDKYRYV